MDHLVDLSVDEMIALKEILQKSGAIEQTGSCGRGDEPSGSQKRHCIYLLGKRLLAS
jgi:hypothetical protein